MQAGVVVDLLQSGKMTAKQKEVFEKILGVCSYFQYMRKCADDSVLAQQARNVGFFMDDLDKESKKI